MNTIIRTVLVLSLAVQAAISLKLKNGREFTGEPVEEKPTALVLRAEGSPITVFKSTIAAVNGVPYDGKSTILKPGSVPAANNPEAVRGIQAYFHGAYDTAQAALQRAAAQIPGTAEVLFYRGLTAERLGQTPDAIAAYRDLLAGQPAFAAAGPLEQRLFFLQNQEYARAAKQAVAGEAVLPPAAATTVVVQYFFNLGANREWDGLQKGLPDLLTADLSRIRSLRVLERGRLQKLLDEMKPAAAGRPDSARAARLARLLGAAWYVTGTIDKLRDGRIQIRATAADLTDGRVRALEPMTGNLNSLFFLEKQLVFALAAHWGRDPSPEELKKIEPVPTQSIPAYFAYARGLDLLDQGQNSPARAQFELARKLDNRFSLAGDRLRETAALAQPCPRLEDVEKAFTEGSVQPGSGKGRKK